MAHDEAIASGKPAEGHGAGAKGNKLAAVAASGISSCHEPISEGEVLERLRLGYWVMIRQGAIRKELDGVRGIFGQPVDKRRLVLCTDGMDPEGFLSEGYLDAAVRYALKLGISPSLVYQMVTHVHRFVGARAGVLEGRTKHVGGGLAGAHSS